MVDRVKPFKNEVSEGEDFLSETDPSEDYIACKGVAFEDLDTHLIDKSGDDIQFTDPTVGTKTVDSVRSTVRATVNDTTPDYLSEKIQAGAGVTRTLVNSGGDEYYELSSAFGTNFDFDEDETESSTTSTAFVEKFSFTTDSLAAGDYYFAWTYECKTPLGNSKTMEVRVQVDDTTTVSTEAIRATKASFTLRSGFDLYTFTAGTHTIDVDFRKIWGQAFIKNVRLIFWSVD